MSFDAEFYVGEIDRRIGALITLPNAWGHPAAQEEAFRTLLLVRAMLKNPEMAREAQGLKWVTECFWRVAASRNPEGTGSVPLYRLAGDLDIDMSELLDEVREEFFRRQHVEREFHANFGG